MDKNKQGFTLIEIIVSLSIMAILGTFGLARYNTFNQQQKLKNEAKKFVVVLELAKKKAVASDLYQDCNNFNGYRVTLTANNYSLNFVCNSTNQLIQNYTFDTNITTTVGTGNFFFPPMGAGMNLTINSIRLRNSKINQCINISISTIGLFDIDNSLISC